MNDYITLKKSDLTLSRQFKILYQGAAWQSGRSQTRKRTVTGKLDIQEGDGGKRWAFTIRCPYEHDDDPWGDFKDLEVFAGHKAGLIIVDHFADEYAIVLMGGQLEARPLTSAVDGDNIWIVQLMIEAIA
ncbi:MAG: hypothetical protein KAJ73_03240 [Zetaproteobacteria bacterium]|nr:hypothetical protein [Zetaproteobacteria bacterium]